MPPCPPAESPHEQSVACPTASSPQTGEGAVPDHRADTLFLQAPVSTPHTPPPQITGHMGSRARFPEPFLPSGLPGWAISPQGPGPFQPHVTAARPLLLSKGARAFQEVIPTGLGHVTVTHPLAAQGDGSGGLRGGQPPGGDTFRHQMFCVLAAPGPTRPGGAQCLAPAFRSLLEQRTGLTAFHGRRGDELQAETGHRAAGACRPKSPLPAPPPPRPTPPAPLPEGHRPPTGALSPGYPPASPRGSESVPQAGPTPTDRVRGWPGPRWLRRTPGGSSQGREPAPPPPGPVLRLGPWGLHSGARHQGQAGLCLWVHRRVPVLRPLLGREPQRTLRAAPRHPGTS